MKRAIKQLKAAFGFVVIGSAVLISTKSLAAYPVCGNGIKEGTEECDSGTLNSDSKPNACRTDCVLPRCGDGVVDSGEECDDHYARNSDRIPDACRTDCKRAHCGDGVVDSGEECDDGNADDYDGCSQCRLCYPPKDDLMISDSLGPVVRLCPGTYELQDNGQEGIIIIGGHDVRVDAADVWLIGANPAVAASSMHQAAAAQNKSAGRKMSALHTKRGKAGVSTSSPQGNEPSGTPPAVSPGPTATMRQGTGIVVTGTNTVLHNAAVQNFRTGIKVKGSGNVLLKNTACGNSTDISGEAAGNFGVKNMCKSVKDWQENGQPGCMMGCQ